MAVKLLCLAAVLARASGFVAPTPERPALRAAPLFDKLATKGLGAFIERAGSIDPTSIRRTLARFGVRDEWATVEVECFNWRGGQVRGVNVGIGGMTAGACKSQVSVWHRRKNNVLL